MLENEEITIYIILYGFNWAINCLHLKDKNHIQCLLAEFNMDLLNCAFIKMRPINKTPDFFWSRGLSFPTTLIQMQSAVITQTGRRTWSAQHTLHGLGTSPLTGEPLAATTLMELCTEITCELRLQIST